MPCLEYNCYTPPSPSNEKVFFFFFFWGGGGGGGAYTGFTLFILVLIFKMYWIKLVGTHMSNDILVFLLMQLSIHATHSDYLNGSMIKGFYMRCKLRWSLIVMGCNIIKAPQPHAPDWNVINALFALIMNFITQACHKFALIKTVELEQNLQN